MQELKDDLTGNLLVAIPNTDHKAYVRGVMMVTAHWSAGSATCMINRPLNGGQRVTSIMRNAGIDFNCPEPIFYGGPDETNRVQFIHTLDWQCASTKHLTKYVGITQEFSILAAIANGTGPRAWRCIAGHRTNIAGAIEGELSGEHPWNPGHRWLVLPATIENTFTGVDDEQWLSCIEESSRIEVASWF